MLKLLELTSLGLFAGCSALANITGPSDFLLQFGALGLVGFMVFQNYRQGHGKDKQLREQNDRLALLIAEDTDAKNRLAQCLEDRPCLAGDQRLQEKNT